MGSAIGIAYISPLQSVIRILVEPCIDAPLVGRVQFCFRYKFKVLAFEDASRSSFAVLVLYVEVHCAVVLHS